MTYSLLDRYLDWAAKPGNEHDGYEAVKLACKRSKRKGNWVTYSDIRKVAKELGFAYKKLFPDFLYQRSVISDLVKKGIVEYGVFNTRFGHGELYRDAKYQLGELKELFEE